MGGKIAKFRIAEYRDLRKSPTEPTFVFHSHWEFYSYPPLVFLKNKKRIIVPTLLLRILRPELSLRVS